METNRSQIVESPEAPVRKVRLVGGVLVALGLIAIIASFAVTLATVLVFGLLLLLAGVVQIVQTLRTGRQDSLWELGTGLLYAFVGLMLVLDPIEGAIGLTLLLAILFFVAGVLRLWIAKRVRDAGGAAEGLIATGVLDLLLGVLLVAGWPATGTWAIGLFVGIELLATGLAVLLAPRQSIRKVAAELP